MIGRTVSFFFGSNEDVCRDLGMNVAGNDVELFFFFLPWVELWVFVRSAVFLSSPVLCCLCVCVFK